jgi:YHS domain-containing protein
MGWLLRIFLFLLLIALVIRSAMRFLEGVIEGANGGAVKRPRARVTGHMVKDPVCGTYVVQGQALTGVRGGQTAWFCSAECQRLWLAEKAKA